MLRTIDDALWDVRHGPLSSEPSVPSLDALSSDTLVVPSAHLLLHGDYARSGLDLLIQDGDDRLVIHDYFRPGRKPDLMAPDGAVLNAATIDAIAVGNGHETAQASGTAPPPIGRVETVGGTASAIRNGVQVVLRPGELVYQGDTVQTDRGGSLAIIFVDGTTFSLSGSSRMVLNELVYQAGAISNSSLMSLVSGSISFVAGQVAKTGDMRVDTPVATMGIRGTAVGWTQLDVTTDGTTQLAVRPERFVVSEEPDGRTGSFEIRSKANGQLLGTLSQNDRAVIVTPTGTTDLAVNYLQKTPADIATEQSIVRGLFGIIASAQPIPTGPAQGPQQPNPNPNPGTGPQNGGAPGSSTAPNGIGGDQPNPLSRSQDGSPPGPAQPGAPQVPPIASLGSTPPAPAAPVIPVPAAAGGTPTPVTIPDNPAPVAVAIVVPGLVGGTPTPVTIPSNQAPVVVAIVVPGLVGRTIALDQKETVVAATRTEGLLARPGVDPATLAVEKVVSAHFGTGASAAGPDVPVAQGTAVPTTVEGRYGTLGIRDDGTYAYVALRAATLHEGETGTDSFTYRTNDGLTQTIVFQVAGHNDAPVPVADAASANLADGGGAIATTTRAAGVLGNDSDPDHDETLLLTVSAVRGSESGTATVNGSATAMARGHYGSLAIASDGTWTYTPDDRATALPGPGHGDGPAHELFTVTVIDPSGASATETLDIAVSGGNHAPTPANDIAATSDGTHQPANGNLIAGDPTTHAGRDTDRDGDTLRISALHADAAAPDTFTSDGIYGQLVVTKATGAYTYTLWTDVTGATAAQVAAVEGLGAGVQATDKFTYAVSDGYGTPDTDPTATLTVTVTGRNDSPTLDLDTGASGADFATTTSGGATAVTGTVAIADPDSGATVASATISITQDGSPDTADMLTLDQHSQDTYHVVLSGGSGTYTLSAAGGYAVSDTVFASALQALSLNVADTAGDHDLQVSIQVSDGSANSNAATSTVHVTGTNNRPPVVDLNGAASGVDTANYDPQVTSEGQTSPHILGGQVSVTDPDGFSIDHATVTLTTHQTNDRLAVDLSSSNGRISASYDPDTYTLTLSAVEFASPADFQAALNNVSLSNSASIEPGSRVLQVTVTDGDLISAPATATAVFQSPLDLNRTYQEDGSSGYATAAPATAGAQTYVAGNVAIAAFVTALDHATFQITDTDGIGSDTLTIPSDVLTAHHLAVDHSGSGTYSLVSDQDGTAASIEDYVAAINAATFSTSDPAARTVTIDVELAASQGTTPYDTATSTIAVGAAAGGSFGYALASVGDGDGDGRADFAASSPGSDHVYVSLSSPSGGIDISGQTGGQLGYALAAIGDLKGDGTSDLIVGAPNAANGLTHPGAAYVIFTDDHGGGNSTAVYVGSAGSDHFAIVGAADGDQAGHAVAGAGYVNGDAIPDVLVGAPGANGDAGAAYLVYGKADSGTVDLGSLAAAGIALTGALAGDHAGASVAGGGDVDKDGRADFLVGAPDAGGGSGAVYLVYGADRMTSASLGDLHTSGAPDGQTITGAGVDDHAGYAVANVGDVNGDGYDDFAIGAPGADVLDQVDAGAVYVIYGGARSPYSGFNLANLAPTQGYAIYGAQAGDHFGSSIAGVGDVDGDGHADFLVGAPDGSFDGRAANGGAYLIHGSASAATLPDNPRFTGDQDGSHLGVSVAGTGDDGSGMLGIAAGAPLSPSGDAVHSGYYVTTGGGGLVQGAILGTRGNDSTATAGTTGNDVIDGQQGNDVIAGHGGNDYLIGGSGSDTFVFASTDASGRTVIADFHPANTLAGGTSDSEHDVFQLTGFTNVDQYGVPIAGAITAFNSHDTLITLDDNHSILLKDLIASSLAASDFHNFYA